MFRIMLLDFWEKMSRAHGGEVYGAARSISEHLQPGQKEHSTGARML